MTNKSYIYILTEELMQKSNIKYRKHFGILFLSIYATFVLVGTLHYHVFNLEQKSTFSDSVSTNRINDLTSDFFSVCSLHQFAQTIDNFYYSSSDIVQSLTLLESGLYPGVTNNFTSLKYSRISPRAPPINS